MNTTDDQYTQTINFPLFALSGDGDDKTHCPVSLAFDTDTGENYGLLFTTREALHLYAYRRDVEENVREIGSAQELIRIGQTMLQRFGEVKRFSIDCPGGPGITQFVTVKDLLYTLRDQV